MQDGTPAPRRDVGNTDVGSSRTQRQWYGTGRRLTDVLPAPDSPLNGMLSVTIHVTRLRANGTLCPTAHTAEECNTALPTDQLHFVRLSSDSVARHFGFTAEKTCASARFHVTTLFRTCQTTPFVTTFVCPLCVSRLPRCHLTSGFPLYRPPVSFYRWRIGPRCLFTGAVDSGPAAGSCGC